MLIKISCSFLALCFLSSLGAVTHAEDNSEVHFGVVDAIYHADSALVVDDTYMHMALSMKVYDHRGSRVNRYSLKQGQRIEYRAVFESAWKISEVKIKSKGFEIPKDND